MTRCKHFGSCPISIEKVNTSPEVIDFMHGYFCNDRFTQCRFYNTAADNCEEAPDDAAWVPGEVIMWLMSGRM